MANASTLVDKATSDLLIGPDWAMNLEICDAINYDPGQTRDVVKAIKKRLGNKSPKVQLLALTVLETIMKNCGEVVHQNVAEKDILTDMVKIVKKKADMAVRDKILVLLDSWQEAFGGMSSRYPQYYYAYDDLRRSGVEFPERSLESSVPMFTPPPTHPPASHSQPAYGSPPYAPGRLEEVMAATDRPIWGSKDMDEAQGSVEVLNDMLNATDPRDKKAVQDELIIQLVEQCRSSQKNVQHLVNNTSDEQLLCQGLALNDELQRALAKYDAIASGSSLPVEPKSSSPKNFAAAYDHEDDEAEDEFSQLAHRSSSRSGRTSSSKESRPPGITQQFSLPPPPQPIRRIIADSSKPANTFDLLSGELIKDASSETVDHVTISQNHQGTHTAVEQSNTNPFADGPSFVATPPQPSITIHQPNQPSPNPTSSGYVVPWASGPQSNAVQQDQMLGNSPPQGPTQYNQQPEVPPLQGSQTSSAWSSYGTISVPNIPPPPVNYNERHRYFQEQTSNSGEQSSFASMTTMASLEQQARNMSLQESQNQQIQANLKQSVSFTAARSSSAPSAAPAKETNPADRLFEDLVDLRSMSANFKKAGMSSSLTRPSKSGL